MDKTKYTNQRQKIFARCTLWFLLLLTALPAVGANLLLVDDDNGISEVRSYYASALNAIGLYEGVDYDVWDTQASNSNEPDAATLAGYKAVIWFSGSASLYGGPGESSETVLGNWLDGGSSRCLFISGQDYLWSRLGGAATQANTFMINYLGLGSFTQETADTDIEGLNSMAGLGPYSLSFPFDNYSDRLLTTLSSGALPSFLKSGGSEAVGIEMEAAGYSTMFWAFPFEAIPNSEDRKMAMLRVAQYCGVARTPPILLVDDDQTEGPDTARHYYTEALNAVGMREFIDYRVWDTGITDNEPSTTDLDGHKAVIWFTGSASDGLAGPGTAAETALGVFLDNGNNLFISGQDYLWGRLGSSATTPNTFMADYLGLGTFTQETGHANVSGTASLAGLGPFALNYPDLNDYSDTLSGGSAASVVDDDNQSIAGIEYQGNGFKTMFWAFPFEAIPTLPERVKAMDRMLEYLGVAHQDPVTRYRFRHMWPTLREPWYLSSGKLAVDETDGKGVMFWADWSLGVIKKFTADGRHLLNLGESGEFGVVNAIALDRTEERLDLYVADNNWSPVRKYTEQGNSVAWPKNPNELLGLSVRGMDTDSDGNVYVLFYLNLKFRVRVYDRAGNRALDSDGSERPDLICQNNGEAVNLAADDSGNIYLFNTQEPVIQKYNRENTLQVEWGEIETDPEVGGVGQFGNDAYNNIDLNSIDVKNGKLYATDRLNSRIQIFNTQNPIDLGEAVDMSEQGFVYKPTDIVADRSGRFYVFTSANNQLDTQVSLQVRKYDLNNQLTVTWKSDGDLNGWFASPEGVATDPDGNIFVVDRSNHRVQKFDVNGVFQQTWGSYGTGTTQFRQPTDIAYDSSSADPQLRRFLVVDSANDRIMVYREDGQITEWNLPVGVYFPGDISVNSSGDIFVTVPFQDKVLRLDPADGGVLQEWTAASTGVDLDLPSGIAVTDDGFVYVIAKENASGNTGIYKFTLDGLLVTKWDQDDLPGVSLMLPEDVAVDQQGFIYVSDTTYNNSYPNPRRIRKFSSSGDLLQTFGDHGDGPEGFYSPHGLTVDAVGRIIVTDVYWNRIQMFEPMYVEEKTRAIIIAGGGNEANNHLWNSTQAMASLAYRTLLSRGLDRENIQFLSAKTEVDLDGNRKYDDVDALASPQALWDALTWAQGAENVYLYMTDHGGAGKFKVNANESVTASDLGSHMATMEGTITGKSTLIYDACEAGSFAGIANSNRRVIFSTQAGTPAYFTGRGQLSFSGTFWSEIRGGASLGQAYNTAKGFVETFPTPQLPGIADPTGGNINQVYIGTGISGSGNPTTLTPPASPVTPATGNIEVTVSDLDGLNRVWAVIYPPNLPPPSSENPLIGLEDVELEAVGTPGLSGAYSGTWDGFTGNGSYWLVFSATDRLGNTKTSAPVEYLSGDAKPRGAIIVAGAQSKIDSKWPGIDAAHSAYQALRSQGFSDNSIEVFSHNWNGSGNDGTPYPGGLKGALTDWATHGVRDPVLVLIGDSDGRSFSLDSADSEDPVPASGDTTGNGDLDNWLMSLQTSGNMDGKLTIIMDGKNAGIFLSRLNTPGGQEENRIRLASTIIGPANYGEAGGVSYSKFLWSSVANGARLPIAHLLAKKAIRVATGNRQQAFLDSDSDRTEDKYDLKRILDFSIGPGILLAGDEPVMDSAGAEVTGYHANGDPQNLRLWVRDVSTTGTLHATDPVWAMVIPPDLDGLGGVEPTPVKVVLAETPAGSGDYEAAHVLTGPGSYNITFYAKDSKDGVSLPLSTTVTRRDSYEIDDSEGQANPIIVDDPAQYHSFHTVNDEDWVTFTAVAGKSYTITADPLGDEADIVLQVIGPAGTGIDITIDDLPAGEQPLGAEVHIQAVDESNSGTYAVRVSLDQAETNLPSDYTLAVTTDGGGSGSTSVAGQVRDTNGNGIGLAFVKVTGTGSTTGSSSTFSLSPQGDYSLGDGPGTYNLTVSKSGYESIPPVAVTIPETGKTIANLTLPLLLPDGDLDGVPDVSDNCPAESNIDQADFDSDGLGDVCDADADNDGLSNSDEQNIHLTNPLNPDSDGDGDSDGDEVAYGSDPKLITDTLDDHRPATPTLDPIANDVQLSGLELTATAFSDPDAGDLLASDQWQFSWDSSFTQLFFDRTRNGSGILDAGARLPVPDGLLEAGQTGFWARLGHKDDQGLWSYWSNPVNYSIPAVDPNDINQDGRPDTTEVNGYTDLDGNGQNDSLQPMIRVYDAEQDSAVGFMLAAAPVGATMATLSPLPQAIVPVGSLSGPLPYGLFSYTVNFPESYSIDPNNPESIEIRMLFDTQIPANAKWVRLDQVNAQVVDVSSAVTVQGSQATLMVTDGALGDFDGLLNARVIDPIGLMVPGSDTDSDGIYDFEDNCTELHNENQLDKDDDGIGNLCDCDFNQDDFCGGPDFTIFVGCFNAPTNGIPNCEAADMNGDGFVGGPDFTRFISGFNGAPGPAAP